MHEGIRKKTLGEAWKLGRLAKAHRFVVGPKPKNRDRESCRAAT
jgi:hypothetical protein